jgi:hypothetical protein
MSAEPMALAKRVLPRLLGEQAIGVINYIRSPERGSTWGGPFNGQFARQALFRMIIANTNPHAIVETGTYLGTTTQFMAQTGLPVFTIEAHPRYYGFARARFWRKPRIKLLHEDSRSALRELFAGPLHSFASCTLFFYLDAHWNDDLPLAEEIDLVFSRCPSAIVMIDDFQVPSDAGYGYDDYGPERALVLGYIRAAISAHQLQAYYPSTPSAAESGARRGCAVLARGSFHGSVLASISLLRLAAMAEVDPGR